MTYQSVCYNSSKYGNISGLELKNFELKKDERGYYLTAKYRVEDQHSIREVDIPKIRLNLNKEVVSIKTMHDPFGCHRVAHIDLGFGELPLDWDVNKDGQSYLFTEKILEEKYTEMTMDEIEKKLGYKVKIVNKKK